MYVLVEGRRGVRVRAGLRAPASAFHTHPSTRTPLMFIFGVATPRVLESGIMGVFFLFVFIFFIFVNRLTLPRPRIFFFSLPALSLRGYFNINSTCSSTWLSLSEETPTAVFAWAFNVVRSGFHPSGRLAANGGNLDFLCRR